MLQWEMVRMALERHCVFYDFRGVPGDLKEDNPLYGLYRFKKGFGGTYTKFTGHKVTTDYTRSMIRRGTSRIDSITDATTKDGVKLNVHMLAITVKRAKSSQQKLIRETMTRMIVENAAEKNLDELVKEIITGKFASNIYHEAKKIYPLKKVETIKTKVLNK